MIHLQADSPEELIQIIKNIDLKVPKRTQGRKTKHTENWIILRFLSTFADTKLFDYPIEVFHQYKPDFRINMSDKILGIEITESIPEQICIYICISRKIFSRRKY